MHPLFLLLGLTALQPQWVVGRSADAPTVLLVGGLKDETPAVERALRSYRQRPQEARPFNLYAIPHANPDRSPLVFPPTGVAYRQNSLSHFLWRWLGMHAPDLVIVAGSEDFGLTAALQQSPVAGMGVIPALHVAAGDPLASFLGQKAIRGQNAKQISTSDAHREQLRRLSRTPHEVAEELAKIYGHDFDSPVYIPAMALISRLRLGQQKEVIELVSPYVDGRKDSLTKVTTSHLAGHLVFAALAEATGDRRYIDRVQAAADLPSPDQPIDWQEMSDGVFMGCPIFASAGKLTGTAAYFDKALRHLQYLQKLCLRPDGLYRHSPLNDAAWGRGNAFPALGLAWTLENIPVSHPAFAEILRSFQAHMATLGKFQDHEGMWHEVIDRSDSYAEFSATAMIAVAMLRGVKHGWLDRKFNDQAHAAWKALLLRIGSGGMLLDVCESTGKQRSLEDYLNRAASSGKDARGGGMAMLLATELQ